MSIFFSSMEVLGKQNIPEHGPVIFTGNHMNQFVDGAIMMITNPKRVGFLVAEKSFKTMVVGEYVSCGALIFLMVVTIEFNECENQSQGYIIVYTDVFYPTVHRKSRQSCWLYPCFTSTRQGKSWSWTHLF